MAQLHYQNLDVHRPDILMKQVFYGLKTFYDFLQRTKKYMESDVAVKRLAWREGLRPEEEQEDDKSFGFWVQLEEPADRRNEPESTFRDFLDENLKEVFEAPGPDDDEGRRRVATRHDFSPRRSIKVLERDPGTYQLLLERLPHEPELLLRPNTWPLHCQIQALQNLQSGPGAAHIPLLRLFESEGHATWPLFKPREINQEDWMVLTDEQRPGTDEQRRFVEIALTTPDFAFLEGPPGSGKTTAICELVLQLAKRGKRVLLCASTHVAVDNVLERLMDERNEHRDLMIPVRIGDRSNVSEKARPWQLEYFTRTERERLLSELRRQRSPSASQKSFLAVLGHGQSVVERLVLDAANLVCGTTIGILQHPDIKADRQMTAAFDVLIVDEASKTTFQEFLVPALLAQRWIVVGDPKQLSPYVDDAAMAVNIESCLQDEAVRNACIDTFLAGHGNPKKRRTAVVAVDSAGAKAYLAQAEARGVDACTVDDDELSLATCAVVVGAQEDLERRSGELPLDVATIRAADDSLSALRRRASAWHGLQDRAREDQPEWASEIGWRFARHYEQRFTKETEGGKRKTTAGRLREQVEELLPVAETGVEPDSVRQEIDRVRRVALPSVLESLRYGFERDSRQKQGTALSDGLPENMLNPRHVRLSTQHRMHGDIAAFSHKHIYDGEALVTPSYLADKRAWGYSRYAHRAVWVEVQGGLSRHSNANAKEAATVINELKEFDRWARSNPRSDGHPWEAAVLTFYRGQEREIRNHLRGWTQNPRAMRYFFRGAKQQPHLTIELCTVDRFQGHEADLVLISFASTHSTSFLESPNRLNVALTRARFQRVVVGDRKAMCQSNGSVLSAFANDERWEQALHEVKR